LGEDRAGGVVCFAPNLAPLPFSFFPRCLQRHLGVRYRLAKEDRSRTDNAVIQYLVLRDPPAKRERFCDGGKEAHLPEAAVMIAFGMYLLENGATAVAIYPDGEHGKKYDIRASLEGHGFSKVIAYGRTNYGGTYERGAQGVQVTLRPGQGDVVARVGQVIVTAECKGGIVNTTHSGQLSKLRRGLCEAVGLLMAHPCNGGRHIAVVPATRETEKVARRILPRAKAVGIEIALVDENGRVTFVDQSGRSTRLYAPRRH